MMAEVLLSCMELALLLFALVQQQQRAAPSNLALVAIIILLIAVRALHSVPSLIPLRPACCRVPIVASSSSCSSQRTRHFGS